ncbi:site-specific integrase [Planococcus sp. 107-1]|uniref:tyrosine-type recombinase/integrase n=1 Tax=Planococcus sp. 107-1 TaxID=2908840 RepID=UPI001F1BB9A1|nr:site-specific integrase [Planococcus sp. 107-1]UJF27919.1 site-specific integrase [Planococcus sp. 107-1]
MHTNPAIKPYKLKNGDIRYMFKIYLGVDPLTGKEVSTTRRTFKTTREAQTIYDRLKNAYREGTYKKQQYITYEEVYEAWKVNYRKKVKPSTFFKTTRLFQNHILPAIGNLRIDKINFAICENYSYYWVEKFERFKSVISYASSVMTYAIKLGYIQTNPFKLVETPKQKKSSNGNKYYSRGELIHFLEAVKNEGNTMIHAFYRLLAYTGMRKSECLALHWCDVDFEEKEIYVYKAISTDENMKLSFSETKTGETRAIKIDSNTLELLKVWQKEQVKIPNNVEKDNSNQLVFPNTKNHLIQPSLTWKWGRNIQEKYSLPYLSPHGFRHTHPTLLTEAGASLVGIQQRLGHSGRDTTTKTYIHHTDKIMDDTLNLFVEYMNY